jgi:hypothetical protein
MQEVDKLVMLTTSGNLFIIQFDVTLYRYNENMSNLQQQCNSPGLSKQVMSLLDPSLILQVCVPESDPFGAGRSAILSAVIRLYASTSIYATCQHNSLQDCVPVCAHAAWKPASCCSVSMCTAYGHQRVCLHAGIMTLAFQ